jgi:hypothetical protein
MSKEIMTPAQNTTAYIQGFEDGRQAAIAEIKRELGEPIAWISSGTIFQIKMKERTNKKTIVASLEKTKVIKHPIYMVPL